MLKIIVGSSLMITPEHLLQQQFPKALREWLERCGSQREMLEMAVVVDDEEMRYLFEHHLVTPHRLGIWRQTDLVYAVYRDDLPVNIQFESWVPAWSLDWKISKDLVRHPQGDYAALLQAMHTWNQKM